MSEEREEQTICFHQDCVFVLGSDEECQRCHRPVCEKHSAGIEHPNQNVHVLCHDCMKTLQVWYIPGAIPRQVIFAE